MPFPNTDSAPPSWRDRPQPADSRFSEKSARESIPQHCGNAIYGCAADYMALTCTNARIALTANLQKPISLIAGVLFTLNEI